MGRKALAPSSSFLNVNSFLSASFLHSCLKPEGNTTERKIGLSEGITEILLFPLFYLGAVMK